MYYLNMYVALNKIWVRLNCFKNEARVWGVGRGKKGLNLFRYTRTWILKV